MPGCALCFGFQRRPCFYFKSAGRKNVANRRFEVRQGLAGISREVSQGNEEVKHDVSHVSLVEDPSGKVGWDYPLLHLRLIN